jgi:Na+-transporting methylmalonyl-CoA/oxaloacetate decarboxylase gamma subunit
VQFEAVIVFVFLVLYMLWAGIKAFFRWVTGETKREREEEQRRQEEDRRRDEERKREEAAERQARADAKKQFEQAILDGQFPTSEVLSVLANCDGNWDDIPLWCANISSDGDTIEPRPSAILLRDRCPRESDRGR